MAVRTEELQLRVLIDGTPARRELAQLDQEYAKLYSELKGVKKGTDEWVASTTRMAEIRDRQAALRKEIGLTGLTAKQVGDELRRLQVAQRHLTPNTAQWAENAARIDQLKQRLRELNNTAEASQAAWNTQARAVRLNEMSMAQLEMETRRLRAALRDLNPNTAEFGALHAELGRVERRMAEVRSGLGPFGRAWESAKGSVMGMAAGVGALFAGGAIMSGMRSWVTGAASMSDAMADVRRTTNLTEEQMNSLQRSLKGIDTRTSRVELLALAADAGKLGISAEHDVLGFVRAGDQIKVALGDDLGDDAIKSLGKLTQTFKIGEERGYDLEKSLLSVGSAINTLGQSSTANEGYMVDYASRMAGVNVQAGISIEQTLGYAAAADQLNLKVETTSTAMTQFTLKAFKEPAAYAKIAGMELGEFNRLLREDTNEALLRTLDGLNGNNAGLETMVQKFGDLGQEGVRAVSTLAAMSGQTKLIREQQDIANRSFAEATSITTEFQLKNENFAGNLEKIGKALRGWFVNTRVVSGFKELTASVVEWMQVPVSRKLEEERTQLEMTYSQILSYNQGTEERTRLIKELQERYPGLLKNMDAEKVSNEMLAGSIREINNQLANKIVLQQEDEKLDKQVQRQARQRMDVIQREKQLRESMTRLARDNNINIDFPDATPLLEQAQYVAERIMEVRKRTQFNQGGGIFDPVARMGKDMEQLRVALSLLESEESVSMRMRAKRNDLADELGLNEPPPAAQPAARPAMEAGAADGAEGDEGEKAKRDAALEAMRKLREDLAKVRRDMELDAMAADERELAQLDDKFAAMRAKVIENAHHTQADLDALDATHQEARQAMLDRQAEEAARKAAEARAKALAAAHDAEDDYWEGKLGEEDAEVLAQMQRMESIVALYEQAGWDTQQVVERTEAAINAIRQRWREKEAEEADRAFRERIAQQVKVYQAVGSAIGGVNDFMAAAYEAAGESQYQQTAGAKVLGLAQIAISSGVGVANAISSGAGQPWPANLAAIATGVAAVLGGIAQAMALLNAAKVSPPGSTGRQVAQPALQNIPLGERGGIFHGPSHAQGGMLVVDRSTGRVAAEVEGGEPWMVLSNAFRRNNPGLVPRLLQASATGGKLAAGGGIFTPAPAFNFRAASESMRLVQLAQGGLLQAQAMPSAPADDASAEILATLRTIAAGIDRVDDGVRTRPERITAEVSLQDLNRRQAELDQVRGLNRVGR